MSAALCNWNFVIHSGSFAATIDTDAFVPAQNVVLGACFGFAHALVIAELTKLSTIGIFEFEFQRMWVGFREKEICSSTS